MATTPSPPMVFPLKNYPMQIDNMLFKPLMEQNKQWWHVNKLCFYCKTLGHIASDALPSSLMDSTTSPKVKTMEGKGVGTRSLVCNTLGVEGCAGVPGWD
jgi:hypothetical protein